MDKKLKRILAIIAVIVILGLYLGSLVFALMGGDLAIPLVMTCILLSMYLAVYFHIGSTFVRLLKGKGINKEDTENKHKEEKEEEK